MMHYSRSGHREVRRRRVLLDETTQQSGDENTPADGNGSANGGNPQKRMYARAARAEAQARLTDLIPRRGWTIVALLFAAALMITSIQLVYAYVFLNAEWGTVLNLTALDVAGTSTVASWFVTISLLWAAVGCYLVYLHRRHKADDYRGTYRWWLWTAVLLVLGSLDAASGLHRIWESMVERWQRPVLLADHPFLVTFAGYGCLALFLVTRLFPDARRSMASLSSLTAAIGCFVVGVTLRLQGWLDGSVAALSESSLHLAGTWLLAFFVWLTARHVFLEAHGIVRPRTRKQRPQRATQTDEAEAVETSSAVEAADDAEAPQTRPTKKRKRKAAAAKAEKKTPAATTDSSDDRTLRIDEPHNHANAAPHTEDAGAEWEAEVFGGEDQNDRRSRKKRRKKRRKAS